MAPRAPFGTDADTLPPPPPVLRSDMSFVLDEGYRSGYNSRANSRMDEYVTPRGNVVRLPNPVADSNYPIPPKVSCPVESEPFKRDNLWNLKEGNERELLKRGKNRMDVSDIASPRQSIRHHVQRDPLMVNDIAGAQTKAKRIENLDKHMDRSLVIYKRNTNPMEPTYGGNIDVPSSYFKSEVSYAQPRFVKEKSQSLYCDDIEKSYSGSLHAHRSSLTFNKKQDVVGAVPNPAPNKRVPHIQRTTNYIDDIPGTRTKSDVREFKLSNLPSISPRSSPDGSFASSNRSSVSSTVLPVPPRDIFPTEPSFEVPRAPRNIRERSGGRRGSKTDRSHRRVPREQPRNVNVAGSVEAA